MRIAVGGKGWLAVRTTRLLSALVEAGTFDAAIEVVLNRDDPGHDTWLPSLAAAAADCGWKTHRRVEEAGLDSGDVFLSLQYDRIVNCSALGGVRTYNLHFARVPYYRGSLTSVWPIRNGDRLAGVTLHILTQGIDAGPIVASATFEIPVFFTAYDLYRAYHAHGFELLTKNLDVLVTGQHEAVPQDDEAATVYVRSSVDFSDVTVSDFDHSAEQVRDYCRSLIFPPAQYPTFGGRPVAACTALAWDNASQLPPGTVVADDPAQVLVACRSGLVCLEYAPAHPSE
jgi:methionyl-tRNA formyltransferase